MTLHAKYIRSRDDFLSLTSAGPTTCSLFRAPADLSCRRRHRHHCVSFSTAFSYFLGHSPSNPEVLHRTLIGNLIIRDFSKFYSWTKKSDSDYPRSSSHFPYILAKEANMAVIPQTISVVPRKVTAVTAKILTR
jgi:hypothetical protein